MTILIWLTGELFLSAPVKKGYGLSQGLRYVEHAL